MAKKKAVDQDPVIQEIKANIKADNVIMGKEVTLKNLRANKTKKIYLAKNTEAATKEEILKYAGLNGVEVHETNINNEQMGVMCKKPYFVSVLSVN